RVLLCRAGWRAGHPPGDRRDEGGSHRPIQRTSPGSFRFIPGLQLLAVPRRQPGRDEVPAVEALLVSSTHGGWAVAQLPCGLRWRSARKEGISKPRCLALAEGPAGISRP